MLDAHLRRPQHVTGRMQAQRDVPMTELLPVLQGGEVGARQPDPHDGGRRARGEIMTVAEPGVVAVGMRDYRPLDGAPGIDEEAPGRAKKALRARHDEVGHACARYHGHPRGTPQEPGPVSGGFLRAIGGVSYRRNRAGRGIMGTFTQSDSRPRANPKSA